MIQIRMINNFNSSKSKKQNLPCAGAGTTLKGVPIGFVPNKCVPWVAGVGCAAAWFAPNINTPGIPKNTIVKTTISDPSLYFIPVFVVLTGIVDGITLLNGPLVGIFWAPAPNTNGCDVVEVLNVNGAFDAVVVALEPNMNAEFIRAENFLKVINKKQYN
jgi:hypothetical protein